MIGIQITDDLKKARFLCTLRMARIISKKIYEPHVVKLAVSLYYYGFSDGWYGFADGWLRGKYEDS